MRIAELQAGPSVAALMLRLTPGLVDVVFAVLYGGASTVLCLYGISSMRKKNAVQS